jgi:ABC-type multidrug transport system fused ATPase/permease subunit
MTPSTDPLTILPAVPARAPEPVAAAYRQLDFLRFLLCPPFYWMLLLLVVEAALAAATTALIIAAGRDMAQEDFLLSDFVWIVVTQSASYVLGATSWIFAERAGFGAYGRYMLRFARDNRHTPALLNDKNERERAEPFLTNETFHIFFELTYELEADLKLFFSLIFNAIVLGFAIDAGLPAIYAAVFALLLLLQFAVRRPVAAAYLKQQRTTNRMTAHTYTAWDNITTGNRYNFRLWHAGFKSRLRAALDAQIRAILAKEGIAAVCGIFSLVVIFGYLAWVAGRNVTDAGVLIALAATLPRQIEMSYSLHGLASGWNDLLAVWTRMGGACQAMRPTADSEFDQRIRFEGIALHDGPNRLPCSSVDDAVAHLQARPHGRLAVRGSNGSGKSTLLAALKGRLGVDAFYWPTSDKLAFAFAHGQKAPKAEEAEDIDDADDIEDLDNATVAAAALQPIQPIQPTAQATAPEARTTYTGYSSGERQLKSLAEIASNTDARVYLLDEWDANLDAKNRASAEHLVALLAARALVVEISHRDRV